MSSVVSLALPYFGMIFIGFFCGKLMKIDEDGLKWMSFYLIYVALPCLFYRLIAPTPAAELANWHFIVITTVSTYSAFALSFVIGLFFTRGKVRESAIQGFLGCYSNIGYMGPGLTLGALGPAATVPTALIMVFDNLLMFTLLPLMMGLATSESMKLGETMRFIVKRIAAHPFNIASLLGVIAALLQIRLPEALDKMTAWLAGSAAPVALFTLGVTIALRPWRGVSREAPAHMIIKLLLHPLLVWTLLGMVGGFEPVWVYTAMLMAALPPALNVFIMARQYDVYVEGASTGVLAGTIASVVTVTALLLLIASGSLPPSPFSR